MDWTAVGTGIAIGASSGGIAAWINAKSNKRKAQVDAEATVAGTYSKLLVDLDAELARRDKACEVLIREAEARCQARIDVLTAEVVRLGGDPG